MDLLAPLQPSESSNEHVQSVNWRRQLLPSLLTVSSIALTLVSGLLIATGGTTSLQKLCNLAGYEVSQRKLLRVQGRDVWVCSPGGAALNSKFPVVVALHGSGDTSLNFMAETMLDKLAQQTGEFIAVFPEMPSGGADSYGFGGATEVEFFREMVDVLVAQSAARRDAIFVVGHSNGGTTALIMQNNAPDLFRAIASVEAGVPGNLTLYNWNVSSLGGPALLVWNRNDPVLTTYEVPACSSCSLFKRTMQMLRHHDASRSGPSATIAIPTSAADVHDAGLISWPSAGQQPLVSVLTFRTDVPAHHWASAQSIPGCFDTGREVWKFFKHAMSPDESGVFEQASDLLSRDADLFTLDCTCPMKGIA